MRSLRTRVFVTVAVVLASATLAAGLLSRRATLVEERQIVGPRRLASLDGVGEDIQAAYALGGWSRVRTVLASRAERLGAGLIAVDTANRPMAASSPQFESVTVTRAEAGGSLSLESGRAGARATMELRGVPNFLVRDAEGLEAGRVYVLPNDTTMPAPDKVLLPAWIAVTIGTTAVALLLTFALSGRILRPVGELTSAAHRMRQGDLDVRVAPRGDDEIARLGRAFNEMADRLAQTERVKRQMVSDVAHELRSPVTNLRCGLEAMQDGLVTMDRDRIDVLHSETLLLQRLIIDLQDLALADAGGLVLDREVVDVAETVRRALGADPGGPPIAITVDADAAHVTADRRRLEQMLRNLIGNARRHTPEDGRIEVRATRQGAQVRIDVADTGCGIPAEHLPHVFDRFYRADPSRDRATGGAGLGLAIVRRLAEAHGGTTTAASQGDGRGTTVTLWIPNP
ncbi:MAG TPA: ATP-binding protein [Vicinamibacterales bacterium]|nr:ATP-binding protein [Vicinamibacterales bacterium]